LILYIAFIHLVKNSLSQKNNYNEYKIDFLLYAAVIFFFCFRGYVGRDWYEYYKIYENTPAVFDRAKSSFLYTFLTWKFIEPLFSIYVSITKCFFPNYLLWLNFNSLIDVILLITIIRYFDIHEKCIFFILFCLFGGISFEIDALRNAKSIYIFLLSLRFLIKQNIAGYMFLNILGCMFHISSLFYIPFYFIANKKINRLVVIGVFFIGYTIFFFRINLFKPIFEVFARKDLGRISVLIDSYNVTSEGVSFYKGGIFGLIERFLTFLILLFKEEKIFNEYRHRIFINAMYLYLLIFLYCSSISILAERLPLLFIFSYWFIYIKLYKLVEQKGVFLFLLLGYGVLKFVSAWSNPMSLYENVFINHMSIDERLHFIKSYE
jgi:hypothetical protein